MKGFRLLCLMLCAVVFAFSCAAAAAKTATATAPAPVTAAEMKINGLMLGDPKDEYQMNTPYSGTDTLSDPMTHQTYSDVKYKGVTLRYNQEDKLVGVDVTDSNHTGPRGLIVGMTANEVYNLLGRDANPTSSTSIFSSGTDTDGKPIPPVGYILRNEDKTFSFVYIVPLAEDDESPGELPQGDAPQQTVQLTVNFDQSGIVTGFQWRVTQ